MKILIAILFLVSTVVIHEYGHYKVGMLLGIKPQEVGIGFGPKIYQKQCKNYKFVIRLFPFGGYVSHGDDMFKEKNFYEAAPWKRLLLALAGPLSNVIYAFVLLLIMGIYIQIRESGFSLINLFNSILNAGKYTYQMGAEVVESTIYHFSNNVKTTEDFVNSFAGPVKAISIMTMYLTKFEYTILLFAGLNMGLFIFNILPFPALDGWVILVAIMEMISRKRANIKIITTINFVGFVIVFIAFMIVLFWDIISKLILNRY